MTFDKINELCVEIAEEDQRNYLENTLNAFMAEQEELEMLELQKQYEFLSYADECANDDAQYYSEM
jgi:hypothetical protein